MSTFIAVAKTEDVPVGHLKSFTVEGKPILIANWEGTFFATQDLCTHDNGPLAEGELVDGEIECPRHGAHFDLRTGRPTMPAVFPIKTYSVRVEGDRILVAID
ncbi:MAG: non-heme iron oxygenase ferredoxin subunit [Chloroflexi bacterium]|nr:non-heme iron oxygenase ferredoxin subunit [Chloroflexota bacterium]